MKILLANYRYFISGGPERYLFNIKNSLEKHAHEIIPFSIQYERNQPTPYSHYFVKPLGERDEVYFHEQKLTLKSVWRTLSRLFYATEVEQAIVRLVNDTSPQIAYILHYLRKLSPSILVGLKRAGIPIVVRLSDYGMLCPQTLFLRENTPCEFCMNGQLLPSIKNRCVQSSLVASSLAALATIYHRRKHYFNLVDIFVTPTMFMYEKMIAAGYLRNQLRCIPTFVNTEVFHPTNERIGEKYIIFAGRLEQIKGVHILIEAIDIFRKDHPTVNFKLRIVGTGNKQYQALLTQQIHSLLLENYIEFLGEVETEQMVSLLNQAFISVVPSIWYENLPNIILESYASGTPVLASNLGSLPECVIDGQTGYLFEAGNAKHLAECLAFCFDHPEKMAEMRKNTRNIVETTYSEKQHLDKLEALFNEVIASHQE